MESEPRISEQLYGEYHKGGLRCVYNLPDHGEREGGVVGHFVPLSTLERVREALEMILSEVETTNGDTYDERQVCEALALLEPEGWE